MQRLIAGPPSSVVNVRPRCAVAVGDVGYVDRLVVQGPYAKHMDRRIFQIPPQPQLYEGSLLNTKSMSQCVVAHVVSQSSLSLALKAAASSWSSSIMPSPPEPSVTTLTRQPTRRRQHRTPHLHKRNECVRVCARRPPRYNDGEKDDSHLHQHLQCGIERIKTSTTNRVAVVQNKESCAYSHNLAGSLLVSSFWSLTIS